MSKPLCFDTKKDFEHWVLLAKQAREVSTPCSDCSKQYKTEMLSRGRCNEKSVKAEFRQIPIRQKIEVAA